MTKEMLTRIEFGNAGTVFPDRTITDLCAEIRRCWIEIRQLTSDIREIRQMYGSLQAKETRYWAEIADWQKQLGVLQAWKANVEEHYRELDEDGR